MFHNSFQGFILKGMVHWCDVGFGAMILVRKNISVPVLHLAAKLDYAFLSHKLQTANEWVAAFTPLNR